MAGKRRRFTAEFKARVVRAALREDKTLSELRFVASQTGTEFESLEMAFRKMRRSIYDAGRGLSTAVDALADLGLRFEYLDGRTADEAYHDRPAANLASRVEPGAAWPVTASCATPHVPIRGAPGEVLRLIVEHHAGRKHLPVVKLAAA